MLKTIHRPLAAPALAILAFVGVALMSGTGADANALYPTGSTGYDVSGFQCGSQPPGSFGIVAVNGGRAFSRNTCLAQQFDDATALAHPPSLYMNLNAPVGTTASRGLTGPRGNCARKDKACISYNYGYNAAADAVAYASSQGAGASLWWLDIETTNSWSKKTADNREVIRGAMDYLQDQAGVTVGVYSTSYQWGVITGGMQLGVPNWVAGASSASNAPSWCGSPFTGSGASVWLVQYISGGFDQNYAC